ncbi:Nn.00g029060.m01.CDS01 [Neocucurbitaria sp. VM-36]
MDHHSIYIDFGTYPTIQLDAEALSNWFPPLAHRSNINGQPIVDKLFNRLLGRYDISKSLIRQTLYTFFGNLTYHVFSAQGETRMRITAALVQFLQKDYTKHGFNARGFHLSRHSFAILAYLAEEYESELLAGALWEFWLACSHAITQGDHRYLDHEWLPAVKKLRDLGFEGMIHGPAQMSFGALATVPHGAWNRGRTPHRMIGALPWPHTRAISAPATRRRHSPNMPMVLANFPNSEWQSPLMSPAGFPRANYFADDIGVLQYQQQGMNMKLNDIDRKLDLLIEQY